MHTVTLVVVMIYKSLTKLNGDRFLFFGKNKTKALTFRTAKQAKFQATGKKQHRKFPKGSEKVTITKEDLGMV